MKKAGKGIINERWERGNVVKDRHSVIGVA